MMKRRKLSECDLVMTHLQLHASTVHPVPFLAKQVLSAKVGKRSMTLNMTVHDFRFFESDWKLYKLATLNAGQT